MVPADQLERPASLQDGKTQANSPIRLFPVPSGRSRTGKKKTGSTQKNRRSHRRPLSINQGLRRHLQAARSYPTHASGGSTFSKASRLPRRTECPEFKTQATPPQTGRSRTGPTRRLCQVADRPEEPLDRSGHGQPYLALPFRAGPRGHPFGFRGHGLSSDTPRPIGLVGPGIHGQRMVGQAYASTDPSLQDLPAGFSPPQGWFGEGCGERAPLALPSAAVGGGSHPRQRALVGRSTRPENVRARLSALRAELQLRPQLDRQGRLRAQGYAPHDLHHAHPHGAGLRLRGLRLSRRRTGRPQPQPLDHPHSGSQPLQQYFHG